ncbi:hypothetical protein [Spongiimicrobium salis]|uniref:hypothetical protein n=1 Tax=Spongiimicrobium salis TaxID=1667022 RepID=UPI00374DC0A2
MRKFSLVFAAAMLLMTGSIFANNGDTEKKPSNRQLAAQIGALLESNNFIVEEHDVTANVKFTLNSDQEIVVLSVDSEDESLVKFVKGRLNYQKVKTENFREGKMYTVPVRMTE